MTKEMQPEALRLAQRLDAYSCGNAPNLNWEEARALAVALRRQLGRDAAGHEGV